MRLREALQWGSLVLALGLVGCSSEEQRTATAMIGSEGGILVSADEMVRLEVPAGAFAEEMRVVIERIDAVAPHGVNTAYRLQPEGITFELPVRIVFDKEEESEAAIAVASREGDGDGDWMAHLDSEFDQYNATIAVETAQLGVFSLFEMLELNQVTAAVHTGSTHDFEMRICVETSEEGDDGIALAPVLATCAPWSHGGKLTGWNVNGERGGREEFGRVIWNGNRATYTAPAQVPFSNPVWVTAAITLPGRPPSGLGARVAVEGQECPMGICRLECETSTSYTIDPAQGYVAHSEAQVTLTYHRRQTHNRLSIYAVSGTGREWRDHDVCTVEPSPASGPLEPNEPLDGYFLIDQMVGPPTYHGGAAAAFDTVETWTCPDGTFTVSAPTQLRWAIGEGSLEAPIDVLEGHREEYGFSYRWSCVAAE